MPETKTVAHRYTNIHPHRTQSVRVLMWLRFVFRISTVGDVSEGYKSAKKYDTLVESKSSDDAGDKGEITSSTPVPQHKGKNSKLWERWPKITRTYCTHRSRNHTGRENEVDYLRCSSNKSYAIAGDAQRSKTRGGDHESAFEFDLP